MFKLAEALDPAPALISNAASVAKLSFKGVQDFKDMLRMNLRVLKSVEEDDPQHSLSHEIIKAMKHNSEDLFVSMDRREQVNPNSQTPSRLSVVVRTLINPCPGRDFDGITSSISRADCGLVY